MPCSDREIGSLARLQFGTAIVVVLALFNKPRTTVLLILHKSALLVVLLVRVSVLFAASSIVIASIVAPRRVLELVDLGGDELVVICLGLGMWERRTWSTCLRGRPLCLFGVFLKRNWSVCLFIVCYKSWSICVSVLGCVGFLFVACGELTRSIDETGVSVGLYRLNKGKSITSAMNLTVSCSLLVCNASASAI